jgi:L,D-transpeptidase YcbB
MALVMTRGNAAALLDDSPGTKCAPPTLQGIAVAQEETTLKRVYGRAPGMLWSQGAKLSSQGRELLQLLNASGQYGLEALDYGVTALNSAQQCLEGRGASTADWTAFDRGLTAAALRFLTDLHYCRVDPRAAGFELPEPRVDFDSVKTLAVMSSASSVTGIVAALEPRFYHYGLLKKALQRYRSMAATPALTQLPAIGRGKLRLGDRYAGAPALRRLLSALGDLSPAQDQHAREQTLDAALLEGLKHFQRRHGLVADGVLGGRTFEVLTTPLEVRVRQIELTLERWRWLPAFDTPPIIVNVPQFTLYAFRSTSDRLADIEQMPVIVGKSFPRTRTPIFVGEMSYVDFRPFWDVPRSITLHEMLAPLSADSRYLERNHLQIVSAGDDSHAQVQEPTREAIGELAAGHYRLRQVPGEDNALGLVKFVFPNTHDVYLHSTPTHQLFLQPRRDFSHGCIRVSDPVALAVYALRDNPGGWDADKVAAAMHAAAPSRVSLAHPIKVMVLYATALALEDGSIQFFDDIYGHDRKLETLLNQRRRRWAAAPGLRVVRMDTPRSRP